MKNEEIYYEVMKTIELEPINMENATDLKLRVEILKNLATGEFHANLWRSENFRIQPSFPQNNGVPSTLRSDEELFVKDITTLSDVKGTDIDGVLQLALRTLQSKFLYL